MDPSNAVKTVNGDPAPDSSTGQKDTSPADMLRMKQQMSSQCFEMAVQLNAGNSKRSCSTAEAERDLPEYFSELEGIKTIHYNSTLALHRMQMWSALGEKFEWSDSEAAGLKVMSDRCMGLSSHIKELQKQLKNLQGNIAELQKKRLDMKRLSHEKMKAMEELMSRKELRDTEKYKAVLEKGQSNLEKYKKMAIMTQNVFRGILLACQVNWLDDPKLRDIAVTLEEFPVSE